MPTPTPFPIMQLADAAGNVIDPAKAVATTAPAASTLVQTAIGGPYALNALGRRLLVPVTGLANAMIHIAGTGVMTLKFSGTADADGVGPAGRRLWKAGTGSLGVSALDITGAVDSEYRVVLGGQFLSIEVTAYTSGSIDVFAIADGNAPMVFVSGPVHTAEEEALRAGRLFTASTGFVSVNAASFLNLVFSNPAGSGKMAYFEGRRFGSTATAPVTYGGISNPTLATFPATGPTTITPANARTGMAASSMSVRFNMSGTRIDSSPANTNPAGGVVSAGAETTLMFKRAVPPGQSFGNFMGGAGGGLAATAVLTMTYYWYEEDLY